MGYEFAISNVDVAEASTLEESSMEVGQRRRWQCLGIDIKEDEPEELHH